jgi:hypothetical protein
MTKEIQEIDAVVKVTLIRTPPTTEPHRLGFGYEANRDESGSRGSISSRVEGVEEIGNSH